MIASAHPSDLASLKAFKEFGAEAVTENRSVVTKSDVVFLSVKPNVVKTALNDVQTLSSGKLFVSIAMGVTLSEIEQILPNDARVIRVMPNTPAIVQAAASVYVRGTKATDDDAQLIRNLLESIGTCDEVTEYMMDPVTALAGSGPAYVCFRFHLPLIQCISRYSFSGFRANRSSGRWRCENGIAERSSIPFSIADCNGSRKAGNRVGNTSGSSKGQRHVTSRKHR